MTEEQVMKMMEAAAGSITDIVNQVAWFVAIHEATQWLSFTLPCIMVGSILIRWVKTTTKQGEHALSDAKTGWFTLIAWTLFAGAVFTGVRGMGPVLQAWRCPTVFVASKFDAVNEILTGSSKGASKITPTTTK